MKCLTRFTLHVSTATQCLPAFLLRNQIPAGLKFRISDPQCSEINSCNAKQSVPTNSILKSQLCQTLLHFRGTHEQIPEKAGPVILHHHHNWALVDCQIGTAIPVGRWVKGIVESIVSPQPVAQLVVEKLHGSHRFGWCAHNSAKSPTETQKVSIRPCSVC